MEYRCPECGAGINLLSRNTQEQFSELQQRYEQVVSVLRKTKHFVPLPNLLREVMEVLETYEKN